MAELIQSELRSGGGAEEAGGRAIHRGGGAEVASRMAKLLKSGKSQKQRELCDKAHQDLEAKMACSGTLLGGMPTSVT